MRLSCPAVAFVHWAAAVGSGYHGAMSENTRDCPLDHAAWLANLSPSRTRDLLLIQDLDGVCMALVHDPLERHMERRYIQAARQMAGHFFVLTNGEHIGRRGVNPIVDAALGHSGHACYLPGLAAGGVQWQDAAGQVSHPGVSDDEMAFLAQVPARAATFLRQWLATTVPAIDGGEVDALVHACVLDNRVSPTLNLNAIEHRLRSTPAYYARLQQDTAQFMDSVLQAAAGQGLGNAFFVHYAPNLGTDGQGRERLKPADATSAGTTDFQFMLRGAVKQAGVLGLLNRYYFARTGDYPLGPDFSVREAPAGHEALLVLAMEHFDPRHMPRIVGVGDTVTSQVDGSGPPLRGGSDRGFLTLVQDLGRRFGTSNLVVYVDSSGGQVHRPAVDVEALRRACADPGLAWPALPGIRDAHDPLWLDVIFPGGADQYIDFFCQLARLRHG